MVLGSGLYLILANTRKQAQSIELTTQEQPPQNIELVETNSNRPTESKGDESRPEHEEELEKLNK